MALIQNARVMAGEKIESPMLFHGVLMGEDVFWKGSVKSVVQF